MCGYLFQCVSVLECEEILPTRLVDSTGACVKSSDLSTKGCDTAGKSQILTDSLMS